MAWLRDKLGIDPVPPAPVAAPSSAPSPAERRVNHARADAERTMRVVDRLTERCCPEPPSWETLLGAKEPRRE